MPRRGFIRRQIGFRKHRRQVASQADFLMVRHQTGDGRSVLEQDECDILIMGAVDAIGKIPGGFGDADGRLSHKIRLSDYQIQSMFGALWTPGWEWEEGESWEGWEQLSFAGRVIHGNALDQ
jgi:hypothetical protein